MRPHDARRPEGASGRVPLLIAASIACGLLAVPAALAGGGSGSGEQEVTASASVKKQLKKLKKQVKQLQAQLEEVSKQPGPQGPAVSRASRVRPVSRASRARPARRGR